LLFILFTKLIQLIYPERYMPKIISDTVGSA
jgi:hypothetical protein